MSVELEPQPSGGTGPIRWIRRTTKSASRHLWLFGWVLVIGFAAKFAWPYLTFVPANSEQYIDRAVVVFGFFILLIGSVIREISRTRKEKYANIGYHLHTINHLLRGVSSYINSLDTRNMNIESIEQSQKLIQSDLVRVLDKISGFFSMLTGTTCRAAIKQIYYSGNGKICVYALTRDTDSNRRNSKNDRKRLEENKDELSENEDFHSIFSEDQPFFFCNDLPGRARYKNTSFDIFGSPPKSYRWWHILLGIPGWTLPYRSTMVWPIQQMESDTLNFDPPGCIGFLAVDSEFRNVFKERFDVPLGAGIADAMFHPLYQYRQLADAMTEMKEAANGP